MDFGIPLDRQFKVAALDGVLESDSDVDLRLKLKDGSHIQVSFEAPALQGMLQDIATVLHDRQAREANTGSLQAVFEPIGTFRVDALPDGAVGLTLIRKNLLQLGFSLPRRGAEALIQMVEQVLQRARAN